MNEPAEPTEPETTIIRMLRARHQNSSLADMVQAQPAKPMTYARQLFNAVFNVRRKSVVILTNGAPGTADGNVNIGLEFDGECLLISQFDASDVIVVPQDRWVEFYEALGRGALDIVAQYVADGEADGHAATREPEA